MKTPKQKLADHLERSGWNLEKIYEADLEWWADEIWELKSRWSPEGAFSFITFLVDPQHEGVRKRAQAVWGVGSAAHFPSSRFEAEANGTISLTAISTNEIEAFLNEVNHTRAVIKSEVGE